MTNLSKQSFLWYFVVVMVLCAFVPSEIYGQATRTRSIKKGVWMGGEIEYVEGEILLKLRGEVTHPQFDALLAHYSVLEKYDLLLPRWKKIVVSPGVNLFTLIEILKNQIH